MAQSKRTIKLYGNGGSRVRVAERRKPVALKTICITLAVLLTGYLLFCYASFQPFSKLRKIYIQTAMSTMNHQWLATALIPAGVIDKVMAEVDAAHDAQAGINSEWGSSGKPSGDASGTITIGGEEVPADEAAFYELFWELDRDTVTAYLNAHPDVMDGGWGNLYINESGLDDEGTSIYTTQGEQVLAIDVPNELLLVRVKGATFRGVLAVAKDPSRLVLQAARGLGTGDVGQFAGKLAQDAGGVLAMTGSGFIDNDGAGLGGILAGYAMCNGEAYGSSHMGYGYKRLELREDNLMYIVDAQSPVSAAATDAVEFSPAMIVDGKTVIGANSGWDALNPRVCIGQSDKYEILMLMTEGRLATSLGSTVMDCADILEKHNCMQALNMDGGTSAVMYYDGAYITRCSNTALPEGRYLPDAWVYGVAAEQ
ncbi:MAG: phosphodiester glycosidase family protein [Oscillospiraceae bacterium]|nr:phosphodiester glycosidase family protein [Oscillospiraceae bacterium]